MSQRDIAIRDDVEEQGFVVSKKGFTNRFEEVVHKQYEFTVTKMKINDRVFVISYRDMIITVRFDSDGWTENGTIGDQRFYVDDVMDKNNKFIQKYDLHILKMCRQAIEKAKLRYDREDVSENQLYFKSELPNTEVDSISINQCFVVRSVDHLLDSKVSHVTYSSIPFYALYDENKNIVYEMNNPNIKTVSIEQFSKEFYPLFRKLNVKTIYENKDEDLNDV